MSVVRSQVHRYNKPPNTAAFVTGWKNSGISPRKTAVKWVTLYNPAKNSKMSGVALESKR